MYVWIYEYMYVCMYVCIYLYIYIYKHITDDRKFYSGLGMTDESQHVLGKDVHSGTFTI